MNIILLIIKKYFQNILFFTGLSVLLIIIKEISNIIFIINIYKETDDLLKILINNLLITFPYVLPFIFFFSTAIWINYLKTSKIFQTLYLGGLSKTILYLAVLVEYIGLILLFIYLSNFVAPNKLNENNKIIISLLNKKPYLKLETFIFNRISRDIIIYFEKFNKDKKEAENIVLYKLKRNKLKSISHVKNGKIDSLGNIILYDGYSYTLGQDGNIGEKQLLKTNIEDYEKIDKSEYFSLYYNTNNLPESQTILDLFDNYSTFNKDLKYYLLYEVNRRFSAVVFIIFLFIVTLLFLINEKIKFENNNIFSLCSIITVFFLYNNIFLKIILKHIIRNIFFGNWFFDIIFMVSILIIFILYYNKSKFQTN